MIAVLSVEPYKGKTVRINLSEGEPVFIDSGIAAEYGLLEGAELSYERVSEAITANTLRKAKERALYLLDLRDYSYVELYKKLEASYPEDICYEVVNRLCELGCIDDRRYAKHLAEQLCLAKKYGLYRAREELKRRGIPRELIDEALAEYEDGSDRRILEVIEKKYPGCIGDEKEERRLRAGLLRLGYSYDEINSAIKRLTTE